MLPVRLLLLPALLIVADQSFNANANVTSQPRTSRVLFLYCNNADSHFGSASTYLSALADKGHQIKVVRTVVGVGATGGKTSKFLSRWPKFNAEEWHLEGYAELNELFRSVVWQSTSGPLTPVDITAITNRAFGGFMLNHSAEIADLLNTRFDLVVVDSHYTVHGYAIAAYHWHTRRTPYVMLHPSALFASDAYAMALGGSWAANLAYFTPLPAGMSPTDGAGTHAALLFDPSKFSHRLENFLVNALEFVGMHHIIPLRHHSNIAKMLPGGSNAMPSMQTFYRNAALHLVDSLLEPGYAAPSAANVFYIGEQCPTASEEERVLPPELRQFVEDPHSRGTIYVALGSFTTWDNCPPGVLASLLGAFNSLSDYRVIFVAGAAAASSSNQTRPPVAVKEHVRLVKWAPQSALLSHPKTRLFFTHGGPKSTREALCAGVALCFLPMFSEQARTTKQSMRLGLGTHLNKFEIEHRPEVVLAALQEALREDAPYAANAKRLGRLYSKAGRKSPIGSALDEAVWWTERVMRMKASTGPKFKPAGVHFWDYCYLALSLFAALAVLLIAV